MAFGFNSLTINLKKVLNKAYSLYLSYYPLKDTEVRFNEDGGGFGVGGGIGVKFTKFLLTNVPPNSTFYITQKGKSSIYENCDDTNSCGTALGEIYLDAGIENSEYIDISNNENIDFINDLVNMYDVQGVIHGANYFGFPAGTEYVPFIFAPEDDDYIITEEIVDISCMVSNFNSIISSFDPGIRIYTELEGIMQKLGNMLMCSLLPCFFTMSKIIQSDVSNTVNYGIVIGCYIPSIGNIIPSYEGIQYRNGYYMQKVIEYRDAIAPFFQITENPLYEDGTIGAGIKVSGRFLYNCIKNLNTIARVKADNLMNSLGINIRDRNTLLNRERVFSQIDILENSKEAYSLTFMVNDTEVSLDSI